jgi:benzoyl-CoA 2,3-dioxygenase component A
MNALVKQHLIDPEICIRCYTCEETCPVEAISHNDDNVVVDAEKCKYCMDCIAPCPTGSIDNWRMVMRPHSLEDQLEWDELPVQEDFQGSESEALEEALENEISTLLEQAHAGTGGRPVAPASAAKPTINLYSRKKPAIATVQGNYRITEDDTDSDVRHIILSLGNQVFPVLEGQSIGIAPPVEEEENPQAIRLYSISSPRDGEKPNTNNLALTVKREENGLCSNYLCDLKKGDQIEITGPFGGTFLMPNDTNANIIMICTGTGSAPFRAFTERRRRAAPGAAGKLLLFFGARTPEELPYFGPLNKLPSTLIEKHLVYSRVPDRPKEYVQDRMKQESTIVSELLHQDTTHIYVCGLKDMETGVDDAMEEICLGSHLNWQDVKTSLRASGRYHVETY